MLLLRFRLSVGSIQVVPMSPTRHLPAIWICRLNKFYCSFPVECTDEILHWVSPAYLLMQLTLYLPVPKYLPNDFRLQSQSPTADVVNRFLHCYLLNARSIVNKLSELHHLLYVENCNMVFITETFLQEYVGNGFLDPSAMFNILRKDRQDGKGGGVCAIVKGDIYVTPVLSSTYGS